MVGSTIPIPAAVNYGPGRCRARPPAERLHRASQEDYSECQSAIYSTNVDSGGFSDWCAIHTKDSVQCPVPTVLECLQSLLDEGRSPSALWMYIAAISWQHAKVDNDTVVSFLKKGAQRLPPPSTPKAPQGTCPWYWYPCSPLETLAEAELTWLLAKAVFLLAITSACK